MKIFSSRQIKEIDEFTIRNEPVSSIDLMERAADQLFQWYTGRFDRSGRALVFVGPGNNGGDGLALARLLSANRYDAEVWSLEISASKSDDWIKNHDRLLDETRVSFNKIVNISEFPIINPDDIIIDAIFGSGLTRPTEGLSREVIKRINEAGCTIVSVDIPSGLFGEDNSSNNPEGIIRANYTLSFEFPKLSFMFAENDEYTGKWVTLPIGLSRSAVRSTQTPYFLLEAGNISSILKERKKFDHKGRFGHGLLVAGSYGKMGAAVLGARAALRTGIGLLSCHVPRCGYQVIQTAVPEAMALSDTNETVISEIGQTENYSSVGIGPGLSTGTIVQKAFYNFLVTNRIPLVIDADGLNILGLNKEWLSLLPANTVLTPHLKEFERIAGSSENSYKRLEQLIKIAGEYNCVILLKGAHSSVITSSGTVYFNNTGNPGMATAGSGDVLTGIILSLLAQGYTAEESAMAGVYIHGLAGDIAASEVGYDSLIASDIIEKLGNAFLRLRKSD